MAADSTPCVSVVVVIVSDTTQARADAHHLAGCLEALGRQRAAPAIEVIVPHHARVDGIDALKQRFPHVRFLLVSGEEAMGNGCGREHHDVLRAHGLLAARGEVVALLEDHARPDEMWCAHMVRAHEGRFAAIGGAIENGIDRPLNWAVYYCDFGKYQNPLPSGDSAYASDANTSYKKAALDSVRELWERRFREVVVNGALLSRGERVGLQPEIIVYQHRSDLQLSSALRERYVWGRSYAVTRCELLSGGKRLVYAALSPLLPLIMLLRLARTAWQRRRTFDKFLRGMPLIALLLAGWGCGEALGYLTRALPRPPHAR